MLDILLTLEIFMDAKYMESNGFDRIFRFINYPIEESYYGIS